MWKTQAQMSQGEERLLFLATSGPVVEDWIPVNMGFSKVTKDLVCGNPNTKFLADFVDGTPERFGNSGPFWFIESMRETRVYAAPTSRASFPIRRNPPPLSFDMQQVEDDEIVFAFKITADKADKSEVALYKYGEFKAKAAAESFSFFFKTLTYIDEVQDPYCK